MPRSARVNVGGITYHVLNRANARLPLFSGEADYLLFEQTLAEAHERVAMRTLAYCLMPTHWHLVLWPREDGDLSEFMRWLTVTHTQRWHASAGTPGRGHIYQGRYKSFPVQTRRLTAHERQAGLVAAGDGVLSVARYVERNALRAGLVRRAEDWRWCSLWRRVYGNVEDRVWLSDPMVGRLADWLKVVNRAQSEEELVALRRSVQRSAPYGSDRWVKRIAKLYGLASTLRPRGRPRTKQQKGS